MFPHHKGLPYKRALRNLARDHLHKTIQGSAAGKVINVYRPLLYILHTTVNINNYDYCCGIAAMHKFFLCGCRLSRQPIKYWSYYI